VCFLYAANAVRMVLFLLPVPREEMAQPMLDVRIVLA
jgi:hypothetical protein